MPWEVAGRAIQQAVPWNWGKNIDIIEGYSTNDGPGDTRRTSKPGFLGIGKTDNPHKKPSKSKNKKSKSKAKSGKYTGGYGYSYGYGGYDSSAADNARKLAFLNDKLGRMPGQLDLINQAEQNRYAHIEDDYNRANSDLEDSWKQTQEDHNTATRQRLAGRRRQIGVADDDFKKQNDAYSRYFARSGAGSSSAAQYTVPTLLARATQKIRNDIEDNNAENARAQETSFNRASLDYKKGKRDILTDRERQRAEAKQMFDTKRAGYWDSVADLERQRADYQGKSIGDIINAGNSALSNAERYAREATSAGGLSEAMKFKPVEYKNAEQKDWTYDPTKTKVEDQQGEEDNENLYKKYFRDKEEEKKKKGWISATAA